MLGEGVERGKDGMGFSGCLCWEIIWTKGKVDMLFQIGIYMIDSGV